MIRKISLRILLLIGITAVLLGLEIFSLFPNNTSPLEQADLSTRDAFMRMRGIRQSNEIVIVAIDDASFNWTGYRWPWPREYFALIVDELNRGGAKVVGLDVLLFEPDPDSQGDILLVEAFKNAEHSVSVMQISREADSESLHLPLPIYTEALSRLGITAVVLDEDAISRSVQAYDYSNYEGANYYNWAFEAASLYLEIDPPSNPTPTSITFNGKNIPLDQRQLLVNFNGPATTFTTYSAFQVVEGDVLAQNPDAFRGKIVLIGATTATLQDVYPTPFSAQVRTPGVEVVANAIDTLINGRYLRATPPWVNLFLIFAMAVLAWLISALKRPGLIITALAGGMLVYLGICFAVFAQNSLYLPIASPLFMLFLGVVIPTLEQAISQEVEKRRVRTLFTRFVSPEMVEQMMETQDINSINKRTNITVLFSDIRGFTTLSEKLSPEGVVALLNPYLEAMTEVIYKHGGTVDKYEGDAIMAFFGEPVSYPDHALRAVRTAVDMRIVLTELKARWEKEGRMPPSGKFEIGIGLNSGEAFVGLLGSAQRINYTAIGDNVNLSARLQDLTKPYKWPILISEATYVQVEKEFDAEFADSVVVKGKTEPVKIYKVLGRKGAPDNERVQALDV